MKKKTFVLIMCSFFLVLVTVNQHEFAYDLIYQRPYIVHFENIRFYDTVLPETEDESTTETPTTETSTTETSTTETLPPQTPLNELPPNEGAKQVEEPTIVIQMNNEGYELISTYFANPPVGMNIEKIEYNKYNIDFHYVVATGSAVNIRKGPNVNEPVVKQLGYFEKLNVYEKVRGQFVQKSNSDEWYRVYWYEGDQIKNGYILASIVSYRTFRLGNAKLKLDELTAYFEKHYNMAKISNYKNTNGLPPLNKGVKFDLIGNERDQAAPIYSEASKTSTFRYLPDGMMVDVTGSEGDFYKAYVFDYDIIGYIPKKYLSFQNQVKKMNQAIIVDIENQNISSFQLEENIWILKSIAYATTGMEAQYKQPTVPGTYAAIQKKDKFLYLDDVTKQLDGYAPFAVRFNGGAYVHGFPVNYKWQTKEQLVKAAAYNELGELISAAVYKTVRVGNPIDPGHIEYSYTLGTVPLSHKCVRNPTSHALFIYNWIKLDEVIIIIED